jgi:predicted transcriptional regulator
MPRTPQDVTEAELGLMNLLWDRGPATIRQLTDATYPNGGVSHYATVQKLLDRLEDKGFVRRERKTSPHTFTAAVNKDRLIDLRLRSIADTFCDGALAPLLTHLVKGTMSTKDRRSLRKLIDELDRPEGRS